MQHTAVPYMYSSVLSEISDLIPLPSPARPFLLSDTERQHVQYPGSRRSDLDRQGSRGGSAGDRLCHARIEMEEICRARVSGHTLLAIVYPRDPDLFFREEGRGHVATFGSSVWLRGQSN